MLRLLWRGHKSAFWAYVLISVALCTLITGVGSLAIHASDKATALRHDPSPTMALVDQLNVLDGLSNYSFLVVIIAAGGSILILTALAQMLVAGASSTVRSLRLYGVSRRSIQFNFATFALLSAALSLIVSFLAAPLVAALHRALLKWMGFDVSGFGISTHPALATTTAIVSGVWTAFVFYLAAGSAAKLEKKPTAKKKWPHVLWMLIKLLLFVGVALGLLKLVQQDINTNNVNDLCFGLMFCTIIAAWCVSPFVLALAGKLMRFGGESSITAGGILTDNASRVSRLSFISALVLGISATAALLTASSFAAGQYQVLFSMTADAVTDDTVQPDSSAKTSGVSITPFTIDEGWRYANDPFRQAPIALFEPDVMKDVLVPEAVAEGDLADLDGTHIVADADDYEIGDEVVIVNDAGEERSLTVAALSGQKSILGSSIGVGADFKPSAPESLHSRTYALAPGGVDQVAAAYPQHKWLTNQQYVEKDLEASQNERVGNMLSMVGGIAVIGLLGLLYSAVGLSLDLRGATKSLTKLGMRRGKALGIYSLVGVISGVVSALISACAIWPVTARLHDLFENLQVDYSVPSPWLLYVVIWLVTTLLVIGGLLWGQKQGRKEVRV